MSQPPDDALKVLWQGQETEIRTMTVEAIRQRAGAYHSRLRGRYLALSAMVAAETVAFAWFAWTARNATIRAGDLMFIAAVAWMAWRIRRRWPNEIPGSLTSAQALVEFHRSELRRQRPSFAAVMPSLLPLLAAFAVILIGISAGETRRALADWAPLVALTAIWVALLGWLWRRQTRRWQREFDEVDTTPLE